MFVRYRIEVRLRLFHAGESDPGGSCFSVPSNSGRICSCPVCAKSMYRWLRAPVSTCTSHPTTSCLSHALRRTRGYVTLPNAKTLWSSIVPIKTQHNKRTAGKIGDATWHKQLLAQFGSCMKTSQSTAHRLKLPPPTLPWVARPCA